MHRLRHSPLPVLLAILTLAFLLRIVGLNWDDHSHLHPDERFLTSTASRVGDVDDLNPDVRERCPDPESFYDYFNTACSVYNPNNVNDGSYAYGTLPLFIVRSAGELAYDLNLGGLRTPELWVDYDYLHYVGRTVNALADVLATLFVYLIGWRMFRSTRLGLIAAFLYACAALPIQLSHYWTVDILAGLFFIIALYMAVEVATSGAVWAYILFGVALGAGVASRINIAPAAVLLPAAALIYLERSRAQTYQSGRSWLYWLVGRRIHNPRFSRLTLPIGRAVLAAVLLCIAGILSLATFRIFQPYAFNGPTFADWGDLNDKWLEDVFYVSNLSAYEDAGWPPSNPWFMRAKYAYPWWNMVMWGMGGMVGIIGTLGLAWGLFRGGQYVYHRLERNRTAVSGFFRPFYPALALLFIWILVYFGWQGGLHVMTMRYYLPLYAPLILLAVWLASLLRWPARRNLLAGMMLFTLIWAYAFTAIYRAPLTRLEASEWVVDELPGTITLEGGGEHLPLDMAGALRYPLTTALNGESYISEVFELRQGVRLDTLLLQFADPGTAQITLRFVVEADTAAQSPIMVYSLEADENGQARLDITPELQPSIGAGVYRWHIETRWEPREGQPPFRYVMPVFQWTEFNNEGQVIQNGTSAMNFRSPYSTVPYMYLAPGVIQNVQVREPFTAESLFIPHYIGEYSDLVFTVNGEEVRARPDAPTTEGDILGASWRYRFDTPLRLTPDDSLTVSADRPIFLTGTVIATEGAWDDHVPWSFCDTPRSDTNRLVRTIEDCDLVNPFALAYYPQVELNMAETDAQAKYLRMVDVLLKADYFTISSNRFYDALPRQPERFTMSARFYDALFEGNLNYELVETFARMPSILGLELRDQVLPTQDAPDWVNELEAEEAFTVYDHPTVFIFRNTGFRFEDFPSDLSYPDERNRITLADYGDSTFTPSEEAPSQADVQRTLVLWLLGFIVLGWVSYPLMLTLFPALPLNGYGFSRGAGWLLLCLIPWWITAATSLNLWSRGALLAILAAYLALNAVLAYRAKIWRTVRQHWRSLLAYEVLFLALFAFGVVLRGVMPDLWHPVRGGEKHMDFAYLNAVLRTSDFPPPNPWLAGFEINYYYFGFVMAAWPIKIGVFAPEVAYNLVLATVYAVVGVNVAGLTYALIDATSQRINPAPRLKIALAVVGVLFVMVAGNLGTLNKMVNPEPDAAPHRWYWYPTRIIGESERLIEPALRGGPITEFPVFSFLYGDLHAHMLALLPVTLYLAVLFSLVKTRRLWLGLPMGALAALILMSNSWDVYLYVPLGVVAMILATRSLPRFVWLSPLVAIGGLVTVAPFLLHFTTGESGTPGRWEGAQTLFEPFLLTWGIPVGVAGVWQIYRAKRVLVPEAATPVELGILIVVVGALATLPSMAATTALLLMLTLGGILLTIFDDRDLRLPHFGLALTFAYLLGTEYIVIAGDVGRLNTVFKITFQLYLWLGLLLPVLVYHMLKRSRMYIQSIFCLVLMGLGLLYPMQAIPGRAEEDAQADSFTLDGSLWMQTTVIYENHSRLALSRDANLIRFMRANLTGFPVIAEWYQYGYAWNGRISSQTGLPAVVGWSGHMSQQYTHQDAEIGRRVLDIQTLYQTDNPAEVRRIIDTYGIDYIVLGELERAYTNPATLDIFYRMVGSGELSIVYDAPFTELLKVEDSPEETASR